MKVEEERIRSSGCQTLYRSLDIISAVANNITMLQDICEHINVSYSTTHRLASVLVQEGYLRSESGKGFSLGPKLIELGFLAYNRLDLRALAHPFLEKLASQTKDTVHLARREGQKVFYLDKVSGQRAVQISSIIGGYKSICETGVGKALLIDLSEKEWREIYQDCVKSYKIGKLYTEDAWVKLMQNYKDSGYAFDMGEDVKEIHCVAAPIRNSGGEIIAAISVSSAIQYMDEKRMFELIPKVKMTALAISETLGYKIE